MWLIFPLVNGPLGLLRDFWSWAVLCVAAWLLLRVYTPESVLLPSFVWSLAGAATANAGQAMVQAYQWWRHTGLSDVYGFMHQRNQLATLCLMGLVACSWLAATPSKLPLAKPALHRATTHTLSVVLGATVSLSASRTGLLGLVLLWLAAEFMTLHGTQSPSRRAMRTPLRFALLGYGLAMLASMGSGDAPMGILARQNAQEGVNVCSSRLSLWANVLQLIGQKPWSGWGWGELDYAHFITLFQTERFCALLSNAHNLPLHLAVELGLPLTLVLCAAALMAVRAGQAWREHNPDRLLAWGVLFAIALHSLLEYPLYYGPFQVSALLCLWILVRTQRQPSADCAPGRSDWNSTGRRAGQVAAGIGLLFVGFVAGDYYRASQIYLPPAQRIGLYRDSPQQHIQHSVFFQDHIDFASLGLATVTPENATQLRALALSMLHFSPEAMVVEKLLTSTRLLGLDEEYAFYRQRFAAAYPQAFARWKASEPNE